MTAGSPERKGMTVWAVTGPIGAGKSAVSRILAAGGAAVVDGDQLGHRLLAEPEIQQMICESFGPQYVVDGDTDRAALGQLVFSNAAALQQLNELTHGPLARLAAREIDRLAAAGQHELAVFEAAVYFLLPSPPEVDLVVSVVAPDHLRVARLLARSGGHLTREAAEARVAAQSAMTAQWQTADEIITNDGTIAELEARVRSLWNPASPGSEKLP